MNILYGQLVLVLFWKSPEQREADLFTPHGSSAAAEKPKKKKSKQGSKKNKSKNNNNKSNQDCRNKVTAKGIAPSS